MDKFKVCYLVDEDKLAVLMGALSPTEGVKFLGIVPVDEPNPASKRIQRRVLTRSRAGERGVDFLLGWMRQHDGRTVSINEVDAAFVKNGRAANSGSARMGDLHTAKFVRPVGKGLWELTDLGRAGDFNKVRSK